ncbi:MAG: DNA replication/repair protein RecF, partial [Lachnospiraceae bacterium]|nr:DNA replication/repair protein RecF [Lachnospiraceae bacterium]
MYIQSVDLDNFRNYGRLHLELDGGVHVFYGDNGQGKSNLLEAVYLAAVNKSFRGSKDKEMIRFGAKEAHVKIVLSRKDVSHRIDLHLKETGNKGIAVDSVPIRKTRDFLGMLKCVMFSPEDLQIVKNGPAERRRFLDTELCVLDPIYFDALSTYRKVLDQRNQLLKDIYTEPSLQDTLEAWDAQLVRYGTMIIEQRRTFLKDLDPLVRDFHEKLSGGKESLSLIYEPNVTAENFAETLEKNRNKDIYAKATGTGPHRDDFEFRITSREEERPLDCRVYGSQGQ